MKFFGELRQLPILILAVIIALLVLLATCEYAYAGGPLEFAPSVKLWTTHGLTEWKWPLEGMVAYEIVGPGPRLYVPAAFAKQGPWISWCEARWDDTRVGLAGERSKWQVHPVHEPLVRELGYTWADMHKARPSLIVAVAIWQVSGWDAWSCSTD